MKVIDIINSGKRTLSFEVFPPKSSDKFEIVKDATEKVASLNPDYMSVTFGAGGNGSKFTLPIAENIEKKYGVPVIHHLTCVGSTNENIIERLNIMKKAGIENVLALRGDIPEGSSSDEWAFKHANELTAFIKKQGDYCVGGACYPECHPESTSLKDDILYLRLKVESGCEYLTTQLFLDNSVFYNFLDHISIAGINAPVTAGIMVITSVNQFNRIVTLSGSAVPAQLARQAARFADDPVSMREAGIDYAVGQIRGLYESGIKNVHLYTMNSAYVASCVKDAIKEYLK